MFDKQIHKSFKSLLLTMFCVNVCSENFLPTFNGNWFLHQTFKFFFLRLSIKYLDNVLSQTFFSSNIIIIDFIGRYQKLPHMKCLKARIVLGHNF